MKTAALAVADLILALCLYGDVSAVAGSPLVSPGLTFVRELILASETQWLAYGGLFFYFVLFAGLEWNVSGLCWWRWDNRNLWGLGWVALGALAYLRVYPASAEPLMALTLAFGLAFGRGTGAGSLCLKASNPEEYRGWILVPLLMLLLLAPLPGLGHPVRTYTYQGLSRWAGPWSGPNIYGLLMGAGIVLAAGLLVRELESKVRWRKTGIGKYGVVIFYLVAVGFMGRGWLHSDSRGAWIATLLGLVFLVWRKVQNGKPEVGISQGSCASQLSAGGLHFRFPAFLSSAFLLRYLRSLRLNSTRLPAFVFLASISVLCFWHFRQTEWHPARRAFSATRTEDFSWRNRVAAWEGDWQMMAEHPWFGAGWNQPEPLYDHYYLPPKLTESSAIQMNDYLLLGATLGVPALGWLFAYIWLSLRPKRGNENHDRSFDFLSTTCHAGAVVLLVGFWFDGGLFHLPTAATFWIILELGAVQPQNYFTANAKQGGGKPQKRPAWRRDAAAGGNDDDGQICPACAGGEIQRLTAGGRGTQRPHQEGNCRRPPHLVSRLRRFLRPGPVFQID